MIRIHTHIGSGSDPVVWQSVTGLSLGLVEEFPDAVALNLGGGYKVGRMSYETSTDLQKVGAPVKKEFEDFSVRTGRKLKLEIEPGTFLVANAGTLLCSVQVPRQILSQNFLSFLRERKYRFDFSLYLSTNNSLFATNDVGHREHWC